MDVLSAIKQRREITQFEDKLIDEKVWEQLIQSLYLAPSGNNIPSRHFIIIKNRQSLTKLSATTPYMKWLAQAAGGIVITGHPQESKYWLQDASIAGGFLWLTATSLGLGAAWGAVYHSEDTDESMRREQFVRQYLQIPEDVRVVAILGVGYPAHIPNPKEMVSQQQVIHYESY